MSREIAEMNLQNEAKNVVVGGTLAAKTCKTILYPSVLSAHVYSCKV